MQLDIIRNYSKLYSQDRIEKAQFVKKLQSQ